MPESAAQPVGARQAVPERQHTYSELPYNPAQAQASCADAFGPGPEGWRCGSCANLRAVHVERATVYYCCIDGSARHVTAEACARFDEAPLAEAP